MRVWKYSWTSSYVLWNKEVARNDLQNLDWTIFLDVSCTLHIPIYLKFTLTCIGRKLSRCARDFGDKASSEYVPAELFIPSQPPPIQAHRRIWWIERQKPTHDYSESMTALWLLLSELCKLEGSILWFRQNNCWKSFQVCVCDIELRSKRLLFEQLQGPIEDISDVLQQKITSDFFTMLKL